MRTINRWIPLAVVVLMLLAGCSSSQTIPQTGLNQPAATSVVTQPAVTSPVQPATVAPSLAPSTQPAATASVGATMAAATQPAAMSASTTQEAAAPALNCTSPAPVTVAETEGPFFKAGSPERSSLLEAGVTGTKLTITGYVLTTDCKPVANALLDFWQANAQGQYDNSGYTLRGHQFTDANGRYQVETVVPGLYTGRTEHIHVKVQAPNGPVLTTQLFFPGVSENETDSIFDPSLVLPIQTTAAGQTATFNFVVSAQ